MTLIDNKFRATYSCQLGLIEIKGGDGGITSLSFSKRRINRNSNHPLFVRVTKQLDEYFSGKRKNFDVPLDLGLDGGTLFQRKIWQHIKRIPYGKTRSYKDIAMATKKPKAARACGSAVGKNPFSIIIPCHRVMAQGGRLGGYAWGLDRKRWLLNHEINSFELT